jgi:RNA polymerase sigma-70 factor (ECF subfamily)
LRRNGRHQAVSLERAREEAAGAGEANGLLEMLQTPGPGPLEQLSAEERRQRVRASVEQLADPYRQVVVLAYYQGMKYRDIADVLDIPVGTVKSRLHAALVKLQDTWNQSPSMNEA